MIELNDLADQQPYEKLQLLEIGKEKSGKSWCAATAPKPILIFDFDLRAKALSGRNGVYAVTLRDPAPHMQPTAFNEMLSVITQLEQGADLRALGFTKAPPGLKPVTIVTDSITTMARSASRYALYTNTDIRRRLSFGSWSVDFAKNFDAWNAEMTTIESVILRLLALPTHLIATLHEEEEKSEDSTPDKKKFTGQIGPFPARYSLLFKYFNDVWHFDNAPSMSNPSSTVYESRAQCRPDYRCPWAVTTLDLDQFEKPNIEQMLSKHFTRNPKSSRPQLAQATAVQEVGGAVSNITYK